MFFKRSCNHKYGKVEKGYQYCELCGHCIVSPCKHIFHIINDVEINNDYRVGNIYYAQCKKCGIVETYGRIYKVTGDMSEFITLPTWQSNIDGGK